MVSLISFNRIGKSWKTHPEISRNLRFPGREADRFLENSSINILWGPFQFCKLPGHWLDRFLKTRPNLDHFSRNRSVSCPKIQLTIGWIFQKSIYLIPRKFANKGQSLNCGISETLLLENSSNRQSENSGASHRPFYWKTHPDQILHIIYGFSQKFGWMNFPIKRPVWWLCLLYTSDAADE